MIVNRKIIEIDEELCDGCGQCVPSCAEGAIEIIDGKAELVADKFCDGLGACLGECPTGALKIVEREADEFDEEAVHEFLAAQEQKNQGEDKENKQDEKKEGACIDVSELKMACGCPSANIQAFAPADDAGAKDDASVVDAPSQLTHWPVKIKLIPPTAPFLKGADILVIADCAALSFPNVHQTFLKGKKALIGCPKFDNADEYIQKFTEIFKTADINSITTVVMEVPCCSGLPLIVKKALEASGKSIPLEEKIIDTKGCLMQ